MKMLITLELYSLFFIKLCVRMHKVKSKEEGKDQESIQSNTTPDPGHHMGKFPIWCPGSGVLFEKVTKTKENITYKRAKRSDLLSR